MVRQPFKVCGEVKTNAHHTDYDKFWHFKWPCHERHCGASAEMRQGS